VKRREVDLGKKNAQNAEVGRFKGPKHLVMGMEIVDFRARLWARKAYPI